MPLSGEPQSIRTRSEESEEGGATQREGGREFKKSVTDQDDENRIAPAGFEVNEEETSKRTWQATLVGTGRDSDMTPDARRVVVGDQHFPEKRARIVRTIWPCHAGRVSVMGSV